MTTFKDESGSEWLIQIDAPTIKRVRQECGVDLADITGQVFQRLDDDAVLLVDVLWVVCREQATARDVNDEAFGRLLVGDPIASASSALGEAIIGFFPPMRRSLMQALAAKNQTMRRKATNIALEKIADQATEKQLLEAMTNRITEELNQALIRLKSASSSPASAVSIQPT